VCVCERERERERESFIRNYSVMYNKTVGKESILYV
jgi:hypothetical protein